MRNNRKRLALVLGSVLSLLYANSASSAQLVTNGTFDSGISGWSLSQVDGFTWSSNEGNSGGALILNNYPGPVPQALQTISGLVVGTTYEITLDAKSHYNCCNAAVTQGAGVSIDGHQFDFLVTNNQPWTQYKFDFQYTGVSNSLILSAQRNGTDSDGMFDNVSITASVPEPETYAMLLAGLGLVGGIANRRKNKKS